MVAPRLEELESALGHAFQNAALAERALTHSSAAGDAGDTTSEGNNEQLEYLGDALIGFLVAEYLVTSFPHWKEGRLSKSRARLVSGAALSAAARRLGLGEHLRLGRGEEKTGGRQKPALLANAFEAVAAAVYLDGGLAAAREFVIRTLLDEVVKAEGAELGLSDHKSALQELLQARGMSAASYHVARESGPDHQKMFWVELSAAGAVTATGTGTTKKEAEQSAAEQALAVLRGEVRLKQV